LTGIVCAPLKKYDEPVFLINVNGVVEEKVALPIARNLMSVPHAINHNSFEDSSKDQALYQKHVITEVPYLGR
jgi:hypothetical protein